MAAPGLERRIRDLINIMLRERPGNGGTRENSIDNFRMLSAPTSRDDWRI